MNQKIFHDFLTLLKFKESYQLQSSGLNYYELHALGKIYTLGQCKTLILAKELCVPASTLIGILDKLEKLELIKRERQTNDKRIVLVSTTDSGAEIILRHLREDELFLKNLVSKLTDKEADSYFELLEKINTHIKNPWDLFKE